MPGITDDDELAVAVAQAGELLQAIQDYSERTNRADSRVRFPRGFIRGVSEHRRRLPAGLEPALRRNISYALLTADIFRWLAIRTDLTATALEMVIKEAICLLGSVCEALSIRPGEYGLGRRSSFVTRTARLMELGVVDERTKADLDWVWNIRAREHLIELDRPEWGEYSRSDYNRALNAFQKLRDGLIQRYP